ncbi:ciliary microtubule inner protein 7 [Gastrophryne carolinensis]
MPQAITGSWFPTSFHGHFRSHLRNDICQEYRMAARPKPPEAFTQRMKENPAKHTFSRHDNRHIFPSSVFSFENGLGKKKLLQHRESYNFIYWKPLEEELKRQRPLISTYRTEFWRLNDEPGKVPQVLSPWLTRATSTSCSGMTTYRDMMRNHVNLHTSNHLTMTGAPQTYNSRAGINENLLRRAKSAPCNRIGVSDCLVWHGPESSKQENSNVMKNFGTVQFSQRQWDNNIVGTIYCFINDGKLSWPICSKTGPSHDTATTDVGTLFIESKKFYFSRIRPYFQ